MFLCFTQGDEAGRTSLGRNSSGYVSGRMPVRVQVHRKLHKDLAELCQVQTLQGHQGSASAISFFLYNSLLAILVSAPSIQGRRLDLDLDCAALED